MPGGVHPGAEDLLDGALAGDVLAGREAAVRDGEPVVAHDDVRGHLGQPSARVDHLVVTDT